MGEPSQFFKDLNELDPGIATRWKNKTHDDPTRKLSDEMAVEILGWGWETVSVKGYGKVKIPDYKRRFSEAQAKAIVLLLDKMDGTIKDTLKLQLGTADTLGKLFDKSVLQQRKTPEEIKRITDFVTLAGVGRIRWTSPYTRFTYFPLQYAALVQLIAERRITIFEEMDGGLVAADAIATYGQYNSIKNSFWVASSAPAAQKRNVIVHELTHAIQDWYDLSTTQFNGEMDAWICGAVTEHATGQRAKQGQSIYDKAFAAAAFVFSSSAIDSNEKWSKARSELEIEIKTNYPSWQGKVAFEPKFDKGKNEPETFRAALRKVTADAQRPGSAWAGSEVTVGAKP